MTVNTKKRGRPKGTTQQLAPSTIVDCAKSLMRSEGKVPSIRKIAGALGVDAMAIYHYFSSKNSLLEAMTVSLVREIYEPKGEKPWQEELERLCKSYLGLLKDHAGLLETMLTMSGEGPADVFTQRFKVALAPLNLTEAQRKDALNFLADYLHGFALAMSCNPKEGELKVGEIDGPLAFYIRALSLEASR
ncbi:TetR family transcriptional regulator [Desulfoluna limicola]|uniref:TetR family transcriptional regulator n=1 Tax=Desulfoluna limicola TaxID=2810562 RepID=A0ABM7PKI7_9BACT|nr:TetR/AcrR family transcriptional regulator [Desulfoluna limicola]BCS97676.1 TetR family transcriptional regulator [Desulfoluna limicola]